MKLNNSPEAVDELNDLPIKSVNGATIYIRDVAHVRDGFPPQRNEVRVDGRRAVLMTVLKSGSASTLAIIDGVKAALPRIEAGAAAVAEDRPAERPVDLREGGDLGRGHARASSPRR